MPLGNASDVVVGLGNRDDVNDAFVLGTCDRWPRPRHSLVARPRQACASVTALEILKQRYAKGEIDKEEFEAEKLDLS